MIVSSASSSNCISYFTLLVNVIDDSERSLVSYIIRFMHDDLGRIELFVILSHQMFILLIDNVLGKVENLKHLVYLDKQVLPYFIRGGQFCPTPKIFRHNFNLGKVTQKRCQTCARNLFFLLFSRKKNFNMSRDLPMMPFLISP